ncbi:MAG: hypothetical protein JW940_36020 [Polyangiaceae bacterium]|nr:hypothetical protein [Polyangiaceae bacterium]
MRLSAKGRWLRDVWVFLGLLAVAAATMAPSCGSTTLECKCPGSQVTCDIGQNCVCDATGAHCKQ